MLVLPVSQLPVAYMQENFETCQLVLRMLPCEACLSHLVCHRLSVLRVVHVKSKHTCLHAACIRDCMLTACKRVVPGPTGISFSATL